MSIHPFSAKIEQIRVLTPDVRELTLRPIHPPEFFFKPGQAIALEMVMRQGSKSLNRYYSLASPPSQTQALVLVVSVRNQDPSSVFFAQQKVGDEILFTGPNGEFQLEEDPGRDYLFVATGTGIAPFRSMLHTLFMKPFGRSVTLLWGLRSENDLYYQEEFNSIAQRHPNFTFVTILSRPHKSWTGPKGRVTSLVEAIPSRKNLAVYVCGHQRMVNEVTDTLREKGDCLIYREKHSYPHGQYAG